MGWFVSKGGQPCFSKIPNWPSLKLHNFFDFNSNNKLVKIPAKLTNFFHPAKFWDPRPPHRPEISVCPKTFVFPHLVTCPLCFCGKWWHSKNNCFFIEGMWMCITIDGKNYDVTLHDFKTFANDHLSDTIFLKLFFVTKMWLSSAVNFF